MASENSTVGELQRVAQGVPVAALPGAAVGGSHMGPLVSHAVAVPASARSAAAESPIVVTGVVLEE